MDRWARGRAGTANRALLAERREAIPVRPAGFEATDFDMHGMSKGALGLNNAALNDLPHAHLVARDFPDDRHGIRQAAAPSGASGAEPVVSTGQTRPAMDRRTQRQG